MPKPCWRTYWTKNSFKKISAISKTGILVRDPVFAMKKARLRRDRRAWAEFSIPPKKAGGQKTFLKWLFVNREEDL
jgi:hypothetical protein